MFQIKTEHGLSKYHSHIFLSHEDYLLFTHAIEEEFKEIATVAIDFSIKDTNNQDEFALKYFGHCIDQTRLSPKSERSIETKTHYEWKCFKSLSFKMTLREIILIRHVMVVWLKHLDSVALKLIKSFLKQIQQITMMTLHR